jgi:hypothetical protein
MISPPGRPKRWRTPFRFSVAAMTLAVVGTRCLLWSGKGVSF